MVMITKNVLALLQHSAHTCSWHSLVQTVKPVAVETGVFIYSIPGFMVTTRHLEEQKSSIFFSSQAPGGYSKNSIYMFTAVSTLDKWFEIELYWKCTVFPQATESTYHHQVLIHPCFWSHYFLAVECLLQNIHAVFKKIITSTPLSHPCMSIDLKSSKINLAIGQFRKHRTSRAS